MTAAIVPAYDEEKTVGDVVRVLKAAREIDEIVVVSDGSTDGTAAAAEAAGADRVLRLAENVGKGGALLRGAAATAAETLFFCDADLVGLTPEFVDRLVAPVREGRCAMRTGLRDRGPLLAPLLRRLPVIAGERALRRRVLEGVPKRFLERFRVEIALDAYCRINRLPVESAPSRGVGQVRKMQKVGFLRGLAGYLAMIWQIAEAFVRTRLARNEFFETSSHAS